MDPEVLKPYDFLIVSFIRKIKKRDGQVHLAEVESKWVNEKYVQKHVRYTGKEVDGEIIVSL